MTLRYKSTANAPHVNRSGNKANGPKPNGRKPKTQITSGGPADEAGLQEDDIIIAINTTYIAARIRGMDDLSTFLEEYTSPNQTVNVTIVRNNQTMTFPVKLGTRPQPT